MRDAETFHAITAAANLRANTAALGATIELPSGEWRLARDGALTAVVDGQWLAGCSVPRRSAERMLEQTVVRGNVGCLLLPSHAQQVAACLRRVGPGCAIVVLISDESQLPWILSCVDFSAELANKRLFFAADASALDLIFESHPGLPLPQQFLRLPTIDASECEKTIVWTQAIFSKQTVLQASRLVEAKRHSAADDTILLAASQAFSLWNDAGAALTACLACESIDTSQPIHSATAFVAERASSAAAILTIDAGRSDSPVIVCDDKPWLAWVTQQHIPAYVASSPRDGLLLADDSLISDALAVGWPRARIAIAGWPTLGNRYPASSGVASKAVGKEHALTLIADVPDLEPTAEVKDYSSWRVVWDALRHELLERPLAVGGDDAAYLDRIRAKHNVPAENFPAALFLHRLIEPAVVIGMARWLLRERVPLTIYGLGWAADNACSGSWAGTIDSREALNDAIHRSAALLDPFFIRPAHPVRACGRPLVKTFGKTAGRILQEASHPPTTPAQRESNSAWAEHVHQLLAS